MSFYLKICLLLIIISIHGGCGISRKVSEFQETAENAFNSRNYEAALDSYQKIIDLKGSRNASISGTTWYRAGISAWELNKTEKTIEYLVRANRNGYSSENLFHTLALAYREIDNLSLEITHLENYVEGYPGGEYINQMRKRLFKTYIESNNLDLALELWGDLEDISTGDHELLEWFFILNRRLGNEEKLTDIATRIINIDDSSSIALRHLGEMNFWHAENRYREELSRYEQNKTRRQYRELLVALDEINAQFSLSRDYFERLWEIAPEPAYAEFLRNIYIRFGNEEKAGYYHKYINPN